MPNKNKNKIYMKGFKSVKPGWYDRTYVIEQLTKEYKSLLIKDPATAEKIKYIYTFAILDLEGDPDAL